MMRRPATAGAAIGKPTPSNYYTFNNGTISMAQMLGFVNYDLDNSFSYFKALSSILLPLLTKFERESILKEYF